MKNLLSELPPYYRIKAAFKRPNIETVKEFLSLLDSYEQKQKKIEYKWYSIEDYTKSLSKIHTIRFFEQIVAQSVTEQKFRLPNWFINRVIKYHSSPVAVKRLDKTILSTLKEKEFDKISYSITYPENYNTSECEYIWTKNINEFYLKRTSDDLNPYKIVDKISNSAIISDFSTPIRNIMYDNFELDVIIRKMLENGVEIENNRDNVY